jgi:hypothetical protein
MIRLMPDAKRQKQSVLQCVTISAQACCLFQDGTGLVDAAACADELDGK